MSAISTETNNQFTYMKKILFTSAMALFLSLGAISCKKDYNCECVARDSNGAELARKNEVITDTKKNAESQCNTKQSQSTGVTTTCEIK